MKPVTSPRNISSAYVAPKTLALARKVGAVVLSSTLGAQVLQAQTVGGAPSANELPKSDFIVRMEENPPKLPLINTAIGAGVDSLNALLGVTGKRLSGIPFVSYWGGSHDALIVMGFRTNSRRTDWGNFSVTTSTRRYVDGSQYSYRDWLTSPPVIYSFQYGGVLTSLEKKHWRFDFDTQVSANGVTLVPQFGLKDVKLRNGWNGLTINGGVEGNRKGELSLTSELGTKGQLRLNYSVQNDPGKVRGYHNLFQAQFVANLRSSR
ncbi:MAG: hypothetical protein ACKVPX_08540 [Myxococcaceae bacterium]